MAERDARHITPKRYRLRTELALLRNALQSAKQKSNNPALVLSLGREVAALEKQLAFLENNTNAG